MVYKYIFSLAVIFFMSCSEIDRDNILDPKNPDSKSDNVILLEAFVNTYNPLPYNDYALDALESLSMDNDLMDQLVILEYHRDTRDFNDPFEADSFNTEAVYNTYINIQSDRFKGVPDIFVNGAYDRVQGASSSINVVNRVKNYVSEQLLEDGQYTIETDFELNGTVIQGKYRIARLGNESSDPTTLRMIITWDSGSTGKYTVSRVTTPIQIDKISAGDYLESDFTIDGVPAGKAENLIFVLTDNTGVNVLHALEKEIL